MKERLIKSLLVFSLLFVILAVPVMATSVITGAGYKGTINIINTSTATTNNSVLLTNSTSNLITGGMLNATATDAAVQDSTGIDVAFMPGWATNPWVIFNPSIGLNASQNNYLYTSGVTGGKICYFPGTAGVTTWDTIISEFGNNFAVETKGYINTGTTSTLVSKSGAFETLVYPQGSITSNIISGTVTSGSPSIQTVGALNNSLYLNSMTRSGFRYDGFYGYITSVDFKLYKSGSPTGNLSCTVRNANTDALIGTIGTMDASTLTTSGTFYTFNTSPVNVYNLNIRVSIEYSGGNSSNNVRVNYNSADVKTGYVQTTYNSTWTDSATTEATWQNFTFTNPNSASVTSVVTSGDHTVKTYANGTNLRLDIDGVNVASTALAGASVLNNSNHIVMFANNSIPYVEYSKIWVGGTLEQHLAWQYAATLTDQSGQNNNPASVSFRTIVSDADVTASLASFGPYTTSATPTPTSASGSWLLPSNPTTPATGMYGEMHMTFIGAGMITFFSNASDISLDLCVMSWAFGWAILLGLLAFRLTMGKANKYNREGTMPMRQGTLLVQAIVSGLVMFYFVMAGGGVIPGWVLLPFAIEALLIIMVRQNGGNVVGG